jgi:hypothetical protein
MNRSPVLVITLATVIAAAIRSRASAADDGTEPIAQLTLADLAAYRAALSGKATADAAESTDLPVSVGFKDLWEHSERFRGRRVVVEGRVTRIFRQGPIGQFPALAELWISSPAGEPFCLVVPQSIETSRSETKSTAGKPRDAGGVIPEIGANVRSLGTFLKMVRDAAADVARLAPLVVCDQPPVPVRAPVRSVGKQSSPGDSNLAGDGAPSTFGLARLWLIGVVLAAGVGGILAYWRLQIRPRAARRSCQKGQMVDWLSADPPLEFNEPSL